jgi:hypothetical protein
LECSVWHPRLGTLGLGTVPAACLQARKASANVMNFDRMPQLHDTIRLAEDIATLVILSGGRMNLALALGLGWPNPLYLKAFEREAA